MKSKLEKELVSCPPGKIRVSRRGSKVQFYLRKHSSEKTGEYLGKDKERTIEIYLRKSYNERALKLIKMEILRLERFQSLYRDLSSQLQELYTAAPDQVKGYLNPVDVSNDDFAAMWEKIPFVPKLMRNTEIHFITNREEHVRSKSELLIANTLERMKIPYKYECPLKLNRRQIIYPDFTVLNSHTRTVYYWEHRGMMDDRDYAKNSVSRIKEYGKAGIYPGKGLIITEETLTAPLASQEIVGIINTYLK